MWRPSYAPKHIAAIYTVRAWPHAHRSGSPLKCPPDQVKYRTVPEIVV
jgi:hypothetical protein